MPLKLLTPRTYSDQIVPPAYKSLHVYEMFSLLPLHTWSIQVFKFLVSK